MTLSEVPLLRPIVVRFADDPSGRTFSGYANDQLERARARGDVVDVVGGQIRNWNGCACPYLPIAEFRRVLDALLEGGDEQPYTVIDDLHVRVHGKVGVADTYVMLAELAATTDGNRWLFDCGGVWSFVEVVKEKP